MPPHISISGMQRHELPRELQHQPLSLVEVEPCVLRSTLDGQRRRVRAHETFLLGDLEQLCMPRANGSFPAPLSDEVDVERVPQLVTEHATHLVGRQKMRQTDLIPRPVGQIMIRERDLRPWVIPRDQRHANILVEDFGRGLSHHRLDLPVQLSVPDLNRDAFGRDVRVGQERLVKIPRKHI